MDVSLVTLAVFVTIGLTFACFSVFEKNLIRAVIYSAVQSTAFAVVLYLLRAPDIVLVYVPISVGLYPAALFFMISKSEPEEKEND